MVTTMRALFVTVARNGQADGASIQAELDCVINKVTDGADQAVWLCQYEGTIAAVTKSEFDTAFMRQWPKPIGGLAHDIGEQHILAVKFRLGHPRNLDEILRKLHRSPRVAFDAFLCLSVDIAIEQRNDRRLRRAHIVGEQLQNLFTISLGTRKRAYVGQIMDMYPCNIPESLRTSERRMTKV